MCSSERVVNFVCSPAPAKSQPHVSQNFISLYDLNNIQASVARKDPLTGEKINKLRKSYEGKVKDLAGRNKAVIAQDELLGLAMYPDEDWHNTKVTGKDLRKGASDSFMANLDKALDLSPGKLPPAEHEKWRNVLALDDVQVKPLPQQYVSKVISAKTPSQFHNGQTTPAERPSRKAAKRLYTDDAFEGYDDAYGDEHAADGSSLNGDEDRRSGGPAKKKRRKVRFDPKPHILGKSLVKGPSENTRPKRACTQRKTT